MEYWMPLAPSYDELMDEVIDLRQTVEYLERKRDQELTVLARCQADTFQLEDQVEELRWHLEHIVKGIQRVRDDLGRTPPGSEGTVYVPLTRIMDLINKPPPPRPSPEESTGITLVEGSDFRTLLGRLWQGQGRPDRER